MSNILLKDSDIAEMLSMSCSWVRHQRYLRRHARPHLLDVDPIMVGSNPRYKIDDVENVIAGLSNQELGGNNGQ